jgi:hypothetical protein
MDSFSDTTMHNYAYMAVIAYLALGVSAYHVFFGWSLIDTIYFTIVTVTTVGYGDICPTTDQEKLFTCAFAFVGVGLIGAALGIVMDGIIAKEDEIRDNLAKGVSKSSESSAQVISTMIMSVGQILAFLVVGTFAFAALEGKSLLDAFYFSCITTTTVGYGDLSMTTDISKFFATIYLIFGTILVAKALGDIAAIPLDIQRKRREQKVLSQFGDSLGTKELAELTSGAFMSEMGLNQKSDQCSQNEFILAMLIRLGKVDKQDLAMCRTQFGKLDADGNGTLDRDDVIPPRGKSD